MALTESTMLSLGSAAPDFSLTDTEGSSVSKSDFDGLPLLMMFLCNHCPYVKHIAPEVAKLARDYADKPIGFVGIQSNDIEEYPSDGPEQMKEEVATRGYLFPYCLDDDQSIAKSYTAACTPDFFCLTRIITSHTAAALMKLVPPELSLASTIQQGTSQMART